MDLIDKKILIIQTGGLDEVVHSLPLIVALKKECSSLYIAYVVQEKLSDLIWDNPVIDKVYEFSSKKNNIFDLISQIKKEKYDFVIDLNKSFDNFVISSFCGAKSKINRERVKKSLEISNHPVNLNLGYAKKLGCKDLNVEFKLPDLSPKYNNEITYLIDNLDKSKKTILIAPASDCENKQWKLKGWVDLINEMKDENNIILVGSQKEKFYISLILSFIVGGNILDLSAKTTISDIEYACKKADIVVGVDSDYLQLAWAAGAKNILSMFFATTSKIKAPFGACYISIESKADCSPCMQKMCTQKTKINKCTKDILPIQIINIVKRVLH